MNVLVTGGAGFIGSHTVVALIEAGHNIVIADNFINSKFEVIKKIESITSKEIECFNVDVSDKIELEKIFANYQFHGVIHFAGFKSVEESMFKPLKYYNNNLKTTIVLAELCLKYNVNRFIFSSSASVYGDNIVPFKEDMELMPPTNPYAQTKLMSEKILEDTARAHNQFKVTILRYFNPIGAHESGKIGEEVNGVPANLMPFILDVAKGKKSKINVYGDDYKTRDGTGVRDYIHVMDLAEAHIEALKTMNTDVEVYNLGSGKGTSVLQLIHAFQEVNGIEIPVEVVERRKGDIGKCYADTSKAEKELGWKAKRGIKQMCLDNWNFAKNMDD